MQKKILFIGLVFMMTSTFQLKAQYAKTDTTYKECSVGSTLFLLGNLWVFATSWKNMKRGFDCHPLRQYAQGFVAINLAANLFCFWRRYGQIAPRPTLAWLPCETAMFGAWPVDSRALRLQSQVGTQTTAKHDHI